VEKELGHNFLARIGKTKLRPGGKVATQWLIESANLNKDSKILEVACNMGTTMISVCKQYGCHIEGIDIEEAHLEKARANIEKAGLSEYLTVKRASAFALPYEDESFDVIINEAMLTMFSNELKEQALQEYYRVLKKGGVLLTHDVCFLNVDTNKRSELLNQLRDTLNMPVEPLTLNEWGVLIARNHFEVEQKWGPMSLVNPRGMIRDEGLLRTIKIIKNAHKKENIETFKKMKALFNGNKEYLGYVAHVSKK